MLNPLKLNSAVTELSYRKDNIQNKSRIPPNLKATNIEEKKEFNETFDVVDDLDDLDLQTIHKMLLKTKVVRPKTKSIKDWVIPKKIECDNSIYIFNRHGIIRRTFHFVQQHRYFDRFIMFLIAISSVNLALETYIQGIDENDTIMIVNKIAGQVFTYFFMIEFVFKLVALGFVMDNGSYLRESWNQLDFFIVVTSLIDNMMP